MFDDLDNLPASVRDIAAVIGVEATLRLIGGLPTCYSGKPGKASRRVIMYVPKNINPDHRLVSIVGLDASLKLVKEFGGEILYPGNCRSIYIKFRNESILNELAQGRDPKVIADEMRISSKMVMNIMQGKAHKRKCERVHE